MRSLYNAFDRFGVYALGSLAPHIVPAGCVATVDYDGSRPSPWTCCGDKIALLVLSKKMSALEGKPSPWLVVLHRHTDNNAVTFELFRLVHSLTSILLSLKKLDKLGAFLPMSHMRIPGGTDGIKSALICKCGIRK